MTCGIYIIRNTQNEKVYTGSAIDISARWKKHKKQLRENCHHSPKLQNAWNKYGEQSFVFEIIKECEEAKLLYQEAFYMTYYNSFDNGYNIVELTLDGDIVNRRFSKEAREKLSRTNMGHKVSDEAKKKISIANSNPTGERLRKIRIAFLGKKHTLETKQRMSQAHSNISDEAKQRRINCGRVTHTGRIFSKETRKKISENSSRLKHSEETKVIIREKRAKQAPTFLGKKHSEETKQKISAKKLGKTGHSFSEESKKKISLAAIGRKHTEEVKQKMSESRMGRICSENSKSASSKEKGRKYFYHPELKVEINLRPTQIPPDGYMAGRLSHYLKRLQKQNET